MKETVRCRDVDVIPRITPPPGRERPGRDRAPPVVAQVGLVERFLPMEGHFFLMRSSRWTTTFRRSCSAPFRTLEAEAMIAAKPTLAPWIFGTRTGKPVTPTQLGRLFQTVLRAAGLPHFQLYDMRNTYASHLIASRAPIDYFAKQLGHRKITTTLTYYAHWFPQGDRQHVEQMELTVPRRCQTMRALPWTLRR